MPVYQREVLRPQTNSATEEKDEEECVPGKRFHFDSASEQCVEVDYQGCFGTGNLFSTFERCEEVCIEDEGMKQRNICNFKCYFNYLSSKSNRHCFLFPEFPDIDVRQDDVHDLDEDDEDEEDVINSVDICQLPPYEEDAFPCRARTGINGATRFKRFS